MITSEVSVKSVIQALQKRLIALGFPLPQYGADGTPGMELWSAMNAALDMLDVPPALSRTTSPTGRAAIAAREGNILTAYKDSAGVLTIGVGHTSAAGPPLVAAGMTITAAEADEILSRDLGNVEIALGSAVTVPLSQDEFDALVSLTFNIGTIAFKNSTLLKKLNAGDRVGAADQFLVWNKAGGKVLQGLVNRRQAERAQFLSA